MKTIMKNISLLLCVVVALASCHRKPLYDECICYDVALIPIYVDWSVSDITPQNVTVLVYNQSDGSLFLEHKFEHNDNDIQSYIELPIGDYDVVIFNEQRNQIDYLYVDGYENISTLNFYVSSDSKSISRSSAYYIQQPGDLAVEIVYGLSITEDLIVYTYSNDTSSKVTEFTRYASEMLMNVVPLKKNATLDITARLRGLNNALMPSLVDLSNIADGYYVKDGNNSSSAATLQFYMNNRTYEFGSTTGTITASVVLFGALEDRFSTSAHSDDNPILLDMLFILADEDGTIVNRVVDITDLIEYEVDDDGVISMEVYIDIEEALPDVDIVESDSGFITTNEEWQYVDVTITI